MAWKCSGRGRNGFRVKFKPDYQIYFYQIWLVEVKTMPLYIVEGRCSEIRKNEQCRYKQPPLTSLHTSELFRNFLMGDILYCLALCY
jgi:hypothetical protein